MNDHHAHHPTQRETHCGTNRETFLARVKDAAARGRAFRVTTDDACENAGYVGVKEHEDLCQRLASEIRAVGGEPYLFASDDDLQAALKTLLVEHGERGVLTWNHPLLARLELAAIAGSLGIAIHAPADLQKHSQPERRQQSLDCSLGITSCELAIAETGTLVMAGYAGRERSTSLLPPVHIAIVERSQIVPDLIDAIAEFSRRGHDTLPSNVTLITGPSKTGDIELQLTTGVHGPGRWIVLILTQ